MYIPPLIDCFRKIYLFQRQKTYCISLLHKLIYLWSPKCTVDVQLCTVRGLCSVGGTPLTAVRLSPCPLQTSGDTKLRAMVTSAVTWGLYRQHPVTPHTSDSVLSPDQSQSKQTTARRQPHQQLSVIKKLAKLDQCYNFWQKKIEDFWLLNAKFMERAAWVIGLLVLSDNMTNIENKYWSEWYWLRSAVDWYW